MKETHIVKHEIESIPGFENVEFTESSGSRLTVPQAFKFARDHNSTLQSLREAMWSAPLFLDSELTNI